MKTARQGAILLIICCLFTSVALGQQAANESDHPRISVQDVNPWTHLDLNNDPANFQFAIVTDRTGGHREGVFEDAVNKLNLLRPEFVMSVGDLIEGYTEDRSVLDHEWDEFNGFVKGLEMPFFYVPGNHDITNAVMAEVWQERFGRSFYHFVYRDVLFLCLNSEDTESSHFGDSQRAFVSEVLAENPDVRWTLVFLHKPLWLHEESESGELPDNGWAEVEEALRGRPHSVFAGHLHRYTKYERNEQDYFVLATTGGASALAGRLHGQFDHVVWVSMTDEGPRIANLLLDGIWDEDVRTESMAAMVDPLLRGTAVAIEPVFVDGESFTRDTTRVRLTNDADVPLRVSATVADTLQIEIHPSAWQVTVPPNSVEFVELVLEAPHPTAAGDLKPVVLAWEAEYLETDVDIPVVDGQARLVLSRQFEITPRKTTVVVDGNLDDWTRLPYAVKKPAQIRSDASSWTGAEDCWFRFGVEIEEDRLVIGVEVFDDTLIMKRAAAWMQDGLEVRIDGRPDPKRSFSTGPYDAEMTSHVFVGIAPGGSPEETQVYEVDRLTKLGVEAVGGPSETGYRYEIAVPLTYFEARQGAHWRRLRLNVAVNDYDDVEGPHAQLWWQPDWRTASTYAGSGTFVLAQP